MNLSENPMYNDDEYYDLADPANAVLIERIQGYGEAGKFILDLLGQAKAGGITMQVKGLSSVPKIKYGEDEIYLSRRISTDADEMAPTHMHWCMSMESYKKSWVQSVLSGVDSAGWLELGNLTTTDLY
ncbi:MAG: hypothetical protein O3B47_03300, partial [bacterium]|nr:hypothetical protein [bacterium]